MPLYCDDSKIRNHALGETKCNGDYEHCNYLIKIGKQKYCGYCPARCTLHQIVKSQAGCITCKHYKKNLDSSKCSECLSADFRINFEVDAWITS